MRTLILRSCIPFLIGFRFMEEVDREISEMKLSLNARARIVAESYLTAASFDFTFPSVYSAHITN